MVKILILKPVHECELLFVMLLNLSTKDNDEEPRYKHDILFTQGQMTQCILWAMTECC